MPVDNRLSSRICVSVAVLLALLVGLEYFVGIWGERQSDLDSFVLEAEDWVPALEYGPNSNYRDEAAEVVIVTAYFPVVNAKHSPRVYERWIVDFFAHLGNTSVLIYTPPLYRLVLQRLCSIAQLRLPQNRTRPLLFVVDFEGPFDVPPIKPWTDEYVTNQHRLDPEHSIHSPLLYAIWNSKPYLVSRASQLACFPHAKYFFWTDIGSFREDPKLPLGSNWPNLARVRDLDRTFAFSGRGPSQPAKLLMEQVTGYMTRESFEAERDFLAGTWWGGTAEAVQWLAQTFYELHNERIQKGLFVGKDQTLFNLLAVQNRNRIQVIIAFVLLRC